MPRDRAVMGPQAAAVGVAVVWLALALPLGAQQPEARPTLIPPAITVTVQDPSRPAQTTSDRLVAAAAHIPIILFWAGVAGTVAVSVWVVSRLIRAFPRRGLTHIVFEDLSAGRDERLARNRVLAQSVISRLQNPRPLATFDLQMDVMPDASEPGFGGLQPVLTMASALESERADRPIKVGAVEFSLRDLLTIISRLFARPPEQHLEGWLIEANGSIEVGAQMLDHRRRRKFKGGVARTPGNGAREPLAWLVRGTNGRESAIADLAAQILVDTDRSTVTSDWRSLRSFHEATLLRDDQRFDAHPETAPVDPKAALSTARGHLARSVSYDASNWIARFSLAVTLCRDDEPLLALKHLAILEKAVGRAWPYVLELREERKADSGVPGFKKLVRRVEKAVGWAWAYVSALRERTKAAEAPAEFDGPGFKELVRHLDTLPECAFLILFNQGIALATQKDDLKSLYDALEVFKQLSEWMPSSSGCITRAEPVVPFEAPYQAIAESVNDQSRTTLALYAMGAHASLIADTYGSSEGARLEGDPVFALQDLLRRIDANCRVQDADHWPSAMSARAITKAALGHVLFKRMDHECADTDEHLNEAQTNFEAGLAAEPRLVRAMLGLAEIYLKRANNERKKNERGRNERANNERLNEWLSRAGALLERAMVINAGCAQGKDLRDRVHAFRFYGGHESGGSAALPRPAAPVAAS